MSSKKQTLDIIIAQGILPLYFYPDTTVSIAVLQTLYDAGVRAVEYTNRGEAALENFKAMVQERDAKMPDMLLGIGTIKNAKQAQEFIDAHADYLISPGMVTEVADLAAEKDILYIPGAMSATEIIMAENAGCTFVKLFPGNLLGTGFVSAIKDIFPAVKFMVTGGVEVDEQNIKDWFKSGITAVGLGSKVIAKDTLENKNYAAITSLITKALDIVRNLKA